MSPGRSTPWEKPAKNRSLDFPAVLRADVGTVPAQPPRMKSFVPALHRHSAEIWTAFFAFLAANALDLFSTWLASPDLAHEWNILERVLGLGWTGLVCAKIVGIGAATLGYAYYLVHRDACYPAFVASRSEFCRHLSFGSYESRVTATTRLLVNIGYFWAGMQAIVVWVAFDNLLIAFGLPSPWRPDSETLYHLFQSVVVGAFVIARFCQVNYTRYLLRFRPVAIPFRF